MNNYNNLDTSKLNYVVYCRKSSEGEDKQVQSLDTQLRELSEHAERNKLNIVKVISESKSAFKTGRDGFNEMMSLIKTGKANAVLVIRANRISRNPIDAGYVVSLMDEKKLRYIRTPNSTCYTSSSTDKMMIGLELIFSKKDSDDKGEMVKEGQKTKALKGIPHGVATLGFLNDKTEEKGNRKWVVDELKLGAIKILLKMFLTGTYSAGKLHRYALKELKLTTVKRKRIGGALIVMSRIYEILKDPIYAGFFMYGGERYELDPSLPRLITESEHEKIKALLAKTNIPKFQHHEVTFAGFVQSDEGAFIGQDVKHQLICDCKNKFAYRSKSHCPKCERKIEQLENPKYIISTYYYNVRKKKAGLPYKGLPETQVVRELLRFIDENFTFSEELAEWSRKYIVEMKEKEINDSVFRKQKDESDKGEYEAKKIRLREMLRDEQITDTEYKTDLAALNMRFSVAGEKKERVDWYSRMIEIVDLTLSTKEILEKGSIQAKRNILSRLGSNLVWDDKNLSIYNNNAVNELVKGIKRAKLINGEFEPRNNVMNKGLNTKTEVFSSVFSTMLRG